MTDYGEAPDNVEMAEEGMWNDEGPDDPNDVGPGGGMPACLRRNVRVVTVSETKNRDGRKAAVMWVRDASDPDGEPFAVRSVKLADAVLDLKPGSLVDLKFLEHRDGGKSFRNVVFAHLIESPSDPLGKWYLIEAAITLQTQADELIKLAKGLERLANGDPDTIEKACERREDDE